MDTQTKHKTSPETVGYSFPCMCLVVSVGCNLKEVVRETAASLMAMHIALAFNLKFSCDNFFLSDLFLTDTAIP